jgi:CheY-like chemotaxis protein
MTDPNLLPAIRNLATSAISTWTVLIVDDEPDNRAIAEKVMTFNGAKVHTAKDGADGLRMLETLHPSFILLDLSMPGMDGWEMFKRLRSNPKTRDIPVLALTAHTMAGDRERVMAAGFDGYIAKPFRLATFMNEIMQCFRELFERSTAMQGAPAHE